MTRLTLLALSFSPSKFDIKMLNAYPEDERSAQHANTSFGETFNRNQFGGFFVASIVTGAAPEVREKP